MISNTDKDRDILAVGGYSIASDSDLDFLIENIDRFEVFYDGGQTSSIVLHCGCREFKFKEE